MDNNSAAPTPQPWPMHHHGAPILQTDLTPNQKLYWDAYNTTTYFTLQTPHAFSLRLHLITLILSGIFLYPIVMVLNNVKSKRFLPALYIQSIISLISCITYANFINNVPVLYPNMAYSKMVLGLAIFTLLNMAFQSIHFLKNYYLSPNSAYNPLKSIDDEMELELETPSSPSTLYENDHDSISDFNLFQQSTSTSFSFKWSNRLSTLSPLITFFHNASLWGLFFYFTILFPTMLADLSLFGMHNRIFNLLAHWIKGGIFFLIGVLSLARYCGCFEQIGGAWNQTSISYNQDPISNSLFIKFHRFIPNNGLILSFEFMESLLIFIYGSTNVFLEHLASPGGAWTAKDLQHVSIAFMYLGAGICGLLVEFKLSSWKKSLYSAKTDSSSSSSSSSSPDLVTPGFSPNPFPIFTIFWTGLLMSKHAQASQLSTEIHVQWGSLLTYGTFFRLLTFILMSYPPFRSNKPTKPLTELITSFCLLSGGLIFMESTDQVIEALAYRGLTPMFTMNVSVGIVALIMAWIMCVFAIKDRLKA
ncbi:hypothetical protein CANINC_004193 [Pichia inconspicua]|uniref:Protein YTP1-like C-terminal domain-containing protein n=1 Tax=Pichia inconspicua TaxID=52247 RepID=A0A4T0WX55_9ASCO|nr:hypothetical protein CANINC_004193 [[Candida] inconspicua]